MPRLYLFAEGATELTFADTVLKPHLAALGVYLHPPVLVAHAKRRRRVHRGGGRNYVPMRNDILRFLAQERSRDVFFTTMIDLYAIHADFPGVDEAEELRHMPDRRVEALEEAFGKDISDEIRLLVEAKTSSVERRSSREHGFHCRHPQRPLAERALL